MFQLYIYFEHSSCKTATFGSERTDVEKVFPGGGLNLGKLGAVSIDAPWAESSIKR